MKVTDTVWLLLHPRRSTSGSKAVVGFKVAGIYRTRPPKEGTCVRLRLTLPTELFEYEVDVEIEGVPMLNTTVEIAEPTAA